MPASEILGHRVVWSAVFLVILLAFSGQLSAAKAVFADRRVILPLCATTVLISINWFTFIWGVNAGFLLEVSLGYYINPLINVVLGILFLGERLRPWQIFAVALAALGVLNLTWSLGSFPWIALTLALTFGFYGLLRKVMPAEALVGLGVETVLLTPVALAFLAWLSLSDTAVAPDLDLTGWVLLILVGVVTAMPLLLFTAGARRLRYSTMGVLQYIGPTGHFLLAVFVYDEPFTVTHLVAFACIWIALVVYSVDANRAHRRRALAVSEPP